jgi:hypothetical protein
MIDRRWRRNDNWLGSEVEDSFVMVDIETGKYVALNSSAAAAWEALALPRTEAEVVQELCARFDVPGELCAASTGALFERMRDLGLVVAD